MEDNRNSLNPSSKFIDQVRSNTKSDLIEITEDKLENILRKFIEKFKKTINWLTPLSIFLTVILVLLTAEFKSFLGLDKSIWNALFVLVSLFSLGWTIHNAYYAIIYKKHCSIEKLIEEVKNTKKK